MLQLIKQKFFYILIIFPILTISPVLLSFRVNAETTRQIVFPVIGSTRYSNDFEASRSNGLHHATDVIAAKHSPIVSPVDGVIEYVVTPQASWGYSIGIKDSEGYTYKFIHMNNDSPGTDNASGGEMNAYGSDMKRGNAVVKGQLLGWVGDSGNAETTVPHLHFEIFDPSNTPLNPFYSLNGAQQITRPIVNPNAMSGEILPYGPYVSTRAQLAVGNVDADNEEELVTSPGRGSTPNIKVLTKSGVFDNKEFMAYDTSFTGGVTVATGDVNGDGIDEIITGTGPGNKSHVKVFSSNGTVIGSFLAYGDYLTGASVTSGDVNGDGIDEIITGTGPGSSTHVKIFNIYGQELSSFFAYPRYSPGVNVAAADINNDNIDEIITAPGPGGGADIKIFSSTGILQSNFLAYDNFYGGISIDVGDVRTTLSGLEIISAPYDNGGADIRLFKTNGQLLASKGLYENWWIGGYDVAAGTGFSSITTGEYRRASLRAGPN